MDGNIFIDGARFEMEVKTKMTDLEKMKSYIETRNTLDAKYNEIEEPLEALCKLLGEKIPEGCFVQVRGWTPSFNDGDPCEFSVEVETMDKSVTESSASGTSLDDEDEEDDLFKLVSSEQIDDWRGEWGSLQKWEKDFYKFFKSIPFDVVEDLFNQQRVYISSDNASIQSYHCGY